MNTEIAMTSPRYLVARISAPTIAPNFYTVATHYRWTTTERAADRFTLEEATQLANDLADYDAHRGIGYEFAVVAEIDTAL